MRIEAKVILKIFFSIILAVGLVLVGVTVWYINSLKNTDELASNLANQFYEDLLAEDYESILTYTYVPDGKTITAEDVKNYILSHEGMELILENSTRLVVDEFGSTELRRIEVKGYDIEENYYYFIIDVKFVDEELLLDFEKQINE